MYHVYEISTGRLVSSTRLLSNIASPLDPAFNYKELPDGDEKGIWNVSTLVFDPRPVKTFIKKEDFIDRFTDAEIELWITSLQTRSLLKRIELAGDTIQINSAKIAGLLNKLEVNGVIAAGRATEIING